MNEIFKDIKGYEGYYQVSNLGRVKGLFRTIIKSNGRSQRIKEKIIKPFRLTTGYLCVDLSINDKGKFYKVHRLVTLAFILNPKNKLCVNHIDSNKTNNNVDNLEWVTYRENITHSYNKRKTSSKYAGVYWHKKTKKWSSSIYINSERIYLGFFDNEVDAYKAYVKAMDDNNIENKYVN